MIDPVGGHAVVERDARLLAESDPMRAARVLFDGPRLQPRGGRQAVVRWLCEELIRSDPAGTAAVIGALHLLAVQVHQGLTP